MIAASRIAPWAWTVSIATAVATWMSAGRLHAFQGADSIVPVLVSLQRWTPFFWGQDRFGMLIPLVAMPLRHPLANMVVQAWVLCVAALLAPFVVARYLDTTGLRWFTAGATANVLLLLMARPEAQFDWLVVQPYALSIALAAAALLAADAGGTAATLLSIVLMLLAHWVNVGVFLLISPLIALRRRAVARAAVVTGCAIAVGFALTRLSPYRTPTAVLPFSEWPQAWSELAGKAPTAFVNVAAPAAAVIATAFGAAMLFARSSDRQPLKDASVACGVGLIYWLATGTSRWVQINFSFPRYIYPSLLMFSLSAGFVAAALLRARIGWVRGPVAVVLLTATAIDYGLPSPGRVRSTIDQQLGALTSDVITSGATVIGGNYWKVWPAVFHANLTTHRQGGSRREVYGLTYRSEFTDPIWMNSPGTVAVAPAGDRTIEDWANRISLTLTPIEHRGTLDVFVGSR